MLWVLIRMATSYVFMEKHKKYKQLVVEKQKKTELHNLTTL